MTAFTIQSVNLAVGPRVFGPIAVGTDESTINLTLDRTPSGGLNARPATSTINVQFEMSFDGGATWNNLASAAFVGGIYTSPLAGQRDVDVFMCSIWNPGTAGRTARATVTVAGTTVRVAGSLTVT